MRNRDLSSHPLQALDLNNSNLTSFSPDVLKTQKTSLKRLYLGGAQLTTLNNATIASLTSLEELDLSKNPWRCDDQLAPGESHPSLMRMQFLQ
jgi:Leucine-rich repeat (LRR) protein